MTFLMASLIMLSASPIAVIPMDSANFFKMQWPQENLPIKITITKNTRTIIIIIISDERDKR